MNFKQPLSKWAEVESRLLTDYFLRESLGAHQHCLGHPERGGTLRGPAGA